MYRLGKKYISLISMYLYFIPKNWEGKGKKIINKMNINVHKKEIKKKKSKINKWEKVK